MNKLLLSISCLLASTLIANAQAPTIQWQKSLGGTLVESGISAGSQQTPDGGYIVCGSSYSNDGDVTGHHGTAIAPLDVFASEARQSDPTAPRLLLLRQTPREGRGFLEASGFPQLRPGASVLSRFRP